MRWFGSGTTVDRIRINDDQEWKVVNEERPTGFYISFDRILHTHTLG